MKVVAMYLPQFYNDKQNNEWWGEGFTDWIACKNAEKLFDNHYQPHIPANNNYYNLLEKETMIWQAQLMKKYGVDGLCFYHYWFGEGQQALTEPVENLLRWQDIDMPFCFYWANDSWVRSWSKITDANAWVEENKNNKDGKEILLEQKYGDEKSLRKHYDYVLPFVKDSRYIRVDDKPLFIIYKINNVTNLTLMVKKWNEWAKEDGLNGFYFLGACFKTKDVSKYIDAILIHEPAESNVIFRETNKVEGLCRINYDEIWEHILTHDLYDLKTYFSGFVSYDDTPRRGRKGICIEGSEPDKFEKYLTRLMAKNAAANSDITFLNAWNEWGEGMHLEPDSVYGYGYLEAIKKAKNNYPRYIDEYIKKHNDKSNSLIKERCNRFECYTNVLDKWMTNKEDGKSISDYLKKNGYSEVAIYGFGILGRHLFKELGNGDINVKYIIDRKKYNVNELVESYYPSDELPYCSLIIVTPFTFINEIREVLPTKFEVISIDVLIDLVRNCN